MEPKCLCHVTSKVPKRWEPNKVHTCVAMCDTCDIIYQIASKITSQRLHFFTPPRICNQSWNCSRNKKLKTIKRKLNMINPQTNTPIKVVMTLLNNLVKLKGFCSASIQILHFFHPISLVKSIFETISPIFRCHHGIYLSQMPLSIQHPNTYCLTIVQHDQSRI